MHAHSIVTALPGVPPIASSSSVRAFERALEGDLPLTLARHRGAASGERIRPGYDCPTDGISRTEINPCFFQPTLRIPPE
jgi:hypothetical protein